jgi:hypothetical protein
MVQLNGNGAMLPNSQPVGLGTKSQVALLDEELAATGVGFPWQSCG